MASNGKEACPVAWATSFRFSFEIVILKGNPFPEKTPRNLSNFEYNKVFCIKKEANLL